MRKIKTKKIIFLTIVFMFFVFNTFANDETLKMMRENYKQNFLVIREIPSNVKIIATGDRIEADALLEAAGEGGYIYKNFKQPEKVEMIKSPATILVMPRIDYLEKYLNALSSKSDILYLFIMEGDKLPGEYGDRSYETYLKSDISKKIPKNVKVFKLKNDSVVKYGEKNNYENSNVFESRVFERQIKPILVTDGILK